MIVAAKTYLLVHGAWHGGWCWRYAADRLRAAGHRVLAPTCTGLGERAHLLSPAVGLATFIQDILGVLDAEELEDVILVGHSFAGAPVTGVADRAPERIRHLVYLDAVVPQDGQSALDLVPPELAAARVRAAEETSGGITLPVPPPDAFGVTEPADVAWLERRLTPHPLRSYTDRLQLAGPVGNGRPRTYVVCTRPSYPVLASVRDWVGRQEGWGRAELAAAHDAMVTAPAELSELLLRIE
jgi:pimeloyl-ACP methyl ester carboxylesterase